MISSTGNLKDSVESLISAVVDGVLGGTVDGSEKGGGMLSSIAYGFYTYSDNQFFFGLYQN